MSTLPPDPFDDPVFHRQLDQHRANGADEAFVRDVTTAYVEGRASGAAGALPGLVAAYYTYFYLFRGHEHAGWAALAAFAIVFVVIACLVSAAAHGCFDKQQRLRNDWLNKQDRAMALTEESYAIYGLLGTPDPELQHRIDVARAERDVAAAKCRY